MTVSRKARRSSGRPEPVGEVLAGYLDGTSLGESLARLGAIEEWAGAVGPKVSRVTRPVEVRGETLVVEVASSAWLSELSMMRRLILDRVNAVRDGPAIGRIRFRLAQDGGSAVRTGARKRGAGRQRAANGKRMT